MMRKRLDEFLIDGGLAASKEEAFVMVTEGRVFVQGQKAVSPSQIIDGKVAVEVRSPARYVGRGAYKLEAALDEFGMSVSGKICADMGAATGGFTQVLLNRGAKKVYAIDTARGKLATKLRYDPRVIVMEGVDVRNIEVRLGQDSGDKKSPEKSARKNSSVSRAARPEFFQPLFSGPASRNSRLDLEYLPEPANLVTIDVSLIGLRGVLPSIQRLLADKGEVIALFKPQYETRDPSELHRGVVCDPQFREELLMNFLKWVQDQGWEIKGKMESPITGLKGNVEYLLYLKRRAKEQFLTGVIPAKAGIQ